MKMLCSALSDTGYFLMSDKDTFNIIHIDEGTKKRFGDKVRLGGNLFDLLSGLGKPDFSNISLALSEDNFTSWPVPQKIGENYYTVKMKLIGFKGSVVVLSVLVDVTANVEYYYEALHHINHGFVQYTVGSDKRVKISMSNADAARILGFNSIDEIDGKLSFIEDTQQVFDKIENIYADSGEEIQYTVLTPSGEKRKIKAAVSKIMYFGIPVYQSEFYDITRSDSIEREKDITFSNIPGFVMRFSVDDDGNYQLHEVSDRFYDFFSEKSVAEKSDFIVENISDAEKNIVLAQVKCINEGEHFSFVWHFFDKFGKDVYFQVEATCSYVQDDCKCFIAAFVDITDQKMLQAELEQEKELYKIVLSGITDSVFDYRVKDDVYVEYTADDTNKAKHIVPSFLNEYKKMKDTVIDGYDEGLALFEGKSESAFFNMHLKLHGINERWAVVTAKTLTDSSGNAIRIVGRIHDSTKKELEKRKQEEMKSRDKLTNLYNREKGEQLLRNYLKENPNDRSSMLYIIDVDSFQTVNDTYGYVFGDAVLSEVAAVLSDFACDDDILMRFGGDEFLLFVTDIGANRAYNLGCEICESIKGIYIGEDKDITISAKIGMVSTGVSRDIFRLYKCAFSALEYIKTNGNESVGDYIRLSYMHNRKLETIVNSDRKIDEIFDIYEESNEDIVSYTFKILERTKDIKSALNILLAQIGRKYNLTSITVFETERANLQELVTYQWSIDGRRPEFGKSLVHKSPSDFMDFVGMFNDNGYYVYGMENEPMSFTFNDRSKAVMSRPFAAVAIYDENVFRGFIVYEKFYNVCLEDDEIQTLIDISRIMAIHIIKTNSDEANNAKSEFLSRMSHDIRTPMNAIMGMTRIAESSVTDIEKVRECLAKIDVSSKYLLMLINDILDMSKIESGRMKLNLGEIEMSRFIEKIETIIKPQAQTKDINFTVETDCSDLTVIGDSLRLNQILVNLLDNALKFTPRDGKVTASFKQVGTKGDFVDVRFSVKDTGIGISKENFTKIFRSFEQEKDDTARNYGGTGLGLAISKSLVEMMGGNIEVESELGKGTEFSFVIPMEKCERSNVSKETAGSLPTVSFDGKRVLLAEDNDLNIEIARTILTMDGFEVEVARNGRQAVDMFFESDEGYYDAVLMDIRMPVMDGLHAADEIRNLDRGDAATVPIVAMTANAFDDDVKLSVRSGMNAHLAKPINVDELRSTLTRLLARREALG